jgi:hypothetical protein
MMSGDRLLWVTRNDQASIGELAAERNLRCSIEVCREIGDEFWEAVGHQELDRLLAYRGAFDEAAGELEMVLSFEQWRTHRQRVGVNWLFRALRALLLGDTGAALEAARQARELADARGYERDIIRAEWAAGLGADRPRPP